MSFSDDFLDKNYKLIKVLGSGGFGRAYLAESKITQEKFVIKDVDLSDLEEKARMLMEQEGFILQKLSHPNIVKCIESRIINNKAYIIMEYADDGDLKIKIKQHQQKNIPFKEENILNWFIEICEAINYIHKQKIIHRDLKPNNIFLMKDHHIKLGDFGIARILHPDESVANTQIGTQPYLSPEIVKGEPYDYRTDIWDLGIILYEMIYFKNPFEAKAMHAMYMNIVGGKIAKMEKKNVSNELTELIRTILRVNPLERPEIKDIVGKCKEILEKIKKE
jgi:NIMA (never in mitosis gene a)-related kinase